MSVFTGTGRLLRLALRRDRILLPVWVVVLVGLLAGIASTLTALYASEAERVAAAAFTAATAAARIFDGPASGTSIGAMTMVEAYGVLAILTALMSAQAVVRHTRQDEETGRAELLGAAVVGHYARLTAALSVAFLANLALAAGMTLVLVGYGLPASGSIVSGAAFGAVGVTFAAIAAVTAQVAQSQRAANGLAGAILGVAFLLRAIGDVLGEVAPSGVELISAWPSWLSPIGWGQQVRPFHQDNLDVFVLFGLLTLVLIGIAFVLTEHRDVGSGMLPQRPGPAEAGVGLRSPLGLAWRLQRGVLLAWAVGITVMAVAFGSVGDSVDEILTSNEQLQQAMGALSADGALRDLFFVFMMGFVGLAATGFTVQALLRARAEEVDGRLEPLLATPVSRHRWLAGHVGIAVAGTVTLFCLAGLGAGLSYGVATGGDFGTGLRGMGGAALAQAPAALALGGFVVAAFALLPRWAIVLGWGALAASLVMGQLGAMLDLPQAVLNISPFTHVPLVPAEPFTLLPVVLLLGAATLLGGLAFAVFRRRDLSIGG
jgi:ABC-2 type transport system permease protein